MFISITKCVYITITIFVIVVAIWSWTLSVADMTVQVTAFEIALVRLSETSD